MILVHWALLGLLLTSLALALGLAHYRYWVRRLTVPLEYVDFESIPTPDGSAIELRRVPLLNGAKPRPSPPVLLVHGIAIDHQNNDVLPDLSLARELARRGHDCWLLTLRSGRSSAHWRERGLMRFDRMSRYDVPMGVARVLERTGATQLDYVGFSMGGMLLYASIGRTFEATSIRKVVILGSPAIVRLPAVLSVGAMLHFLPWWLVPTIPIRLLSRLFAFAAEWFRSPVHDIVYNNRNVERGIARTTMMTIQDVPSALALDFARWARRGGPIDVEGEPVLERLANLEIPALFFAGAADNIAPADAVRAAFEAWGKDVSNPDKRFVLLGAEHGAADDYGHGDLAIGRRAKEDIFLPACDFLANADTRESAKRATMDVGASNAPGSASVTA
jgi:polyhydroxyalkanoate synthase subunit PhaC